MTDSTASDTQQIAKSAFQLTGMFNNIAQRTRTAALFGGTLAAIAAMAATAAFVPPPISLHLPGIAAGCALLAVHSKINNVNKTLKAAFEEAAQHFDDRITAQMEPLKKTMEQISASRNTWTMLKELALEPRSQIPVVAILAYAMPGPLAMGMAFLLLHWTLGETQTIQRGAHKAAIALKHANPGLDAPQ